MKKCTEAIVDWLISYEAVGEEERELYQYAIDSALLTLAPVVLAGGIGFCLGSVSQGIALVLPFIVMRKYSGGYHAKKLRSCIVGSGIFLLLCMILSMYTECDWKLALVTIVLSVSLVIFSPIEHENRTLDENERIIYKKITLLLLLLLAALSILLFMLRYEKYVVCVCIGIQMTAVLQIPCVLKKYVHLPKNAGKCRFVQRILKS